MQPESAQPLYRIISEVEHMERQPDGTYRRVYLVSFRTALGQNSSVLVPRSETLAADIHAAVTAEAQQLVSVRTHPAVPVFQPPQG